MQKASPDMEETLQLTCSIGISLYPEHGRAADELVKHADYAMYEIKRGGPNNVSVYQPLSGNKA